MCARRGAAVKSLGMHGFDVSARLPYGICTAESSSMRHIFSFLVGTILIAITSRAAEADRNSMLLVVCEPGVPYFSIETLIVDTDAGHGPSVGGNGLLPLRSMIGKSIECMVGTRKVQADLTKFYEPNLKRALEAADIVVTIDGEPAAELHATHRNTEYSDGRARVEVDAYTMLTCESTSNDWATERFPPDRKDHERRSLLCISKFLPSR
jgi:hypothetical protein